MFSALTIASANFWIGFAVTCGLASGMVWGVVKAYHNVIAHFVRERLAEEERRKRMEEYANRFDEMGHKLDQLEKLITPNGKNTQRLGDIVARSEEKIDNLMEFMTRYAEKVDQLEQDMAEHIGYHRGADL